MKSEPEVYGIENLQADTTADWEGVRNYQARNMMRDEMKVGDGVLFYHSNAKPPGVAGLAKVVKTGLADYTAWDKKSKYFDPKTNKDEPRWFMVNVEFVEKFADVVALTDLRDASGLEEMMVIKRGMRLSIQPVTASEFKIVKRLGKAKR